MGRGFLSHFDLKEMIFKSYVKQLNTPYPPAMLCTASAGAWWAGRGKGRGVWLVAAQGTGGNSGIPQDKGAGPFPGF